MFIFVFSLCSQVLRMKLKFVVLIVLNLSGSFCNPHEKAEVDSIRLPGHTRPINYHVDLTMHVHNGTRVYGGNVKIKIVCDVATDVITLHNKGLNISIFAVKAMNNEELAKSITLDASRDFLFVNLDRQLTVGDEYFLYIFFDGLLSMGKSGFYRMDYKNVESGETK